MIINYLQDTQIVTEDHSLVVATQLKNILLKVFGSREDYSNYDEEKQQHAQGAMLAEEDPSLRLDDGGKNVLQNAVLNLL